MDDDSILTALGLTEDDIGPPPSGVFESALDYAFNSQDELDDSTVPEMGDEPVVPDDADDSQGVIVVDDESADDHGHHEHPAIEVEHPLDDADPVLGEPGLDVDHADFHHGDTDGLGHPDLPDAHDDGGPELHL